MKYLLSFLLLFYSIFANAETSYTAKDNSGTSVTITVDKLCTALPLKGWLAAEVYIGSRVHEACAVRYEDQIIVINKDGEFMFIPLDQFKKNTES